MKISVDNYCRLLKAYGFLSFPRKVGNPYQRDVFDIRDLISFIRDNTGKKICFISNISYPKLDRFFKPQTVSVDKLFIDLDSQRKLENALKEARMLDKWLTDQKVPVLATFSGGKGFHIYPRFKARDFKYNEALWRMYRAVHTYIKHQVKLKTIDRKCKNPNRLCRIPFTRYVTMKKKEKNYIVGDTYCTPLTSEMLHKKSLKQIIELAKDPEIFIPPKPRPWRTLLEWIDKQRGDTSLKEWILEWESRDEINLTSGKVEYTQINEMKNDAFLEMIKNLVYRPCIWNELFTYNPCHEARRMAVVALMRTGYTTTQDKFDELVSLFNTLAERCGWVDKNYGYRRVYQIHSIYTASPPYKLDKCRNIKTYRSSTTGKSLCVGKVCPKFVEGL